jgi:hypothetical protein
MAAVPLLNGKVVDLTGPRLTARWGVTCTDLGASVIAPNGKLVSVFGPNYARQLWHYVHDDAATGWTHGGISTVIPSDLLRVDDSIYLHAIVNRGFVVAHGRGRQVSRQPARRIRPVLVWDYDPDDGWVCVVATGFQRDKGIILMRVRPEHIGQRSRYVSWGLTDGRWAWGQTATPITPEEAFQEQGRATLRRLCVAGLAVRHSGRHRADGVTVAHRRRMALPGNAIQGCAEGRHEDRAAARPDQPVSSRP